MHVPREAIVRRLRDHGRHEDADRAELELPDRLHTAQDVEFFERWGLDPSGFEGETFRDRAPPDD